MSSKSVIEAAWASVINGLGADRVRADAALAVLVEAYREPHRHYHTLDHIAALLDLVDRQSQHFTDLDAVRLAILYHDVIYDPRRSDNEVSSARVAEKELGKLDIDASVTAKVARFVEATQHSAPQAVDAEPDLARFLDLDLSILAAERSVYADYALDIRKEFSIYPDQLYRPGRRKVLRSFLDRPRLFLCDDLHATWDRPARDNLQWEIAQLDDGVTPGAA